MVKKNKILIVCLLFALCFSLVLPKSCANQKFIIDFNISYLDDSKGIERAEFNLYKIGELDNDFNIKINKKFKAYPIDFNLSDSQSINDYAESLKAYIKRDKIKEDFKEKTNKDGQINLKLEKGLYLVVGENLRIGEYKYKTSPFIAILPEFDKVKGSYLKKTTLHPKYSKEKILKKYTKISVLKIWDDMSYEDKRPSYIDVILYENSKEKASVRLSKANNWRHTWEKLNPESSWTVIEKDAQNRKYKVKTEYYGDSFTITNIYNPPERPEKKPPIIPHTGRSYLPIYILSALGIVSILFGYLKKGDMNEK